MTTRDPSKPFPAIFTAWVYDKLGKELASPKMFKAWLAAGMIREAEEGYAPTLKGRHVAIEHYQQAQAKVAEQVRAKRNTRSKQTEA